MSLPRCPDAGGPGRHADDQEALRRNGERPTHTTPTRPQLGTEASLRAAALAGGSSKDAMVEVMGFEPTASSMRPRRSSQLSYTPVRERSP